MINRWNPLVGLMLLVTIGVFVGFVCATSPAAAEPPVLADLVVEPPALTLDTGKQTVTISVQVSASNDGLQPNSVKVRKVREGKKNKTLAILGDDGTNGDEMAGDGRFTAHVLVSTRKVKRLVFRLTAKDLAGAKADPLEAVLVVEPPSITSDKLREMTPNVEPEDFQALVDRNSAFAFDFYHAVRDQQDNLFFSPYSLSLALAMTYAGARGDTEQQMADALQFALPQDRLHPAFNLLDQELQSRAEPDEEDLPFGSIAGDSQNIEGFQLSLVNATWGQAAFEFLDSYLDVLAEQYGARLRLLDFIGVPDESRLTINAWIDEQTQGRIPDLLPEDSITGLTRLVLTNAVFFKAAWRFPFDEELTQDGPFTRLDGSSVTVPMMSQEPDTYRYTDMEEIQVIEIPYSNAPVSMVILLPDLGRFDDIERSLNVATIRALLASLTPAIIDLTMPKFAFDSSFDLRETFEALGMVDAFSERVADFSGINDARCPEPECLLVDNIQHKASIAVNEIGTEAAAATAVVIRQVGLPPGPFDMTLDRPFIFVIVDRATDTILFLGRVLNPAAG